MAVPLLLHPFHVNPGTGRPGVAEQGSDEYKAQQIASFVRTGRGARRIYPAYGVDDPRFAGFDAAEFYDGFSDFYGTAEVDVQDVTVIEDLGALDEIRVEFE